MAKPIIDERFKRPNLKRMIRKTGMSQAEFSDEIGIDQRQISGFITGKFNPDNDELVLLAKGLNCEISDVVDDFKGV